MFVYKQNRENAQDETVQRLNDDAVDNWYLDI